MPAWLRGWRLAAPIVCISLHGIPPMRSVARMPLGELFRLMSLCYLITINLCCLLCKLVLQCAILLPWRTLSVSNQNLYLTLCGSYLVFWVLCEFKGLLLLNPCLINSLLHCPKAWCIKPMSLHPTPLMSAISGGSFIYPTCPFTLGILINVLCLRFLPFLQIFFLT